VKRNALILAAVIAVAIAAVVDSVRSDGSAGAAERAETPQRVPGPNGVEDVFAGPEAPPVGSLDGMLVLALGDRCELRLLELSTRRLSGLGPATTCRVWASPDGEHAVAEIPWESGDPSPPFRLALVWLGDPPETVRVLGELQGDPSWSPDGARVAWCNAAGETTILDVSAGREQTASGCLPLYAPDGSLLTVELLEPPSADVSGLAPVIRRDGGIALDSTQLAGPLGAPEIGLEASLELLAYDEAADGLLVVTAAFRGPGGTQAVLELWRDGALETSVDLGRSASERQFGAFLQFNPGGTLLAVSTAARNDRVVFVDLRLRRPLLDIEHQRAFDWSADGAWLAIAKTEEIVIYGANGGDPVYQLPLDVSGLAWAPAAE
jgi:hypothetical protein